MKPNIFVSYATEDDAIATALKDLIQDAFVGTLDVFVSSESLRLGDPWLSVLQENLQNAALYISVLSPWSVEKHWVLFEAGSAFGRKIRLISVCVRGLQITDLESPFKDFQAIQLDSLDSLNRLLQAIARQFECQFKSRQKLLRKVVELAEENPDDLPPPLPAAALQRGAELQGEVLAELGELLPLRRIFWELLGEAYADFRCGRGGYPDTIRMLAELATPPKGIPLPSGEQIREYPATKHALSLCDDSKRIYDFCNAVYPAKQEDKTLAELSIIPNDKFDTFHKARGKHSFFFMESHRRAHLPESDTGL